MVSIDSNITSEAHRARTICIHCGKLMSPKERETVSEEELQGLVRVEEEEQDAVLDYGPSVDEKLSLTWAVRLTRRAIDRQHGVIVGLPQALGVAQSSGPNESPLPPSKNAPAKPKSSPGINYLPTGPKSPNPQVI